MKAILFDLDGTLVDTLGDITASLNHALKTHGFEKLSLDAVRQRVGQGLSILVEHSMPAHSSPETIRRVLHSLKDYYQRNPVRLSRPYPGICSLINEFAKQGTYLGIISNKDEALVRIIAENFFPGRFSAVYGRRPERLAKPDPSMVWEVTRSWGINLDKTVFIGDSEVDVEMARQAGLGFIGVSWGYRDKIALRKAGAGIIVDHVNELLSVLDN